MTAEIFLASTLGCLVAIVVTCVFFRTVYVPLQGWLLRRAFKRATGNSGDLVTVGAGFVPCSLESTEEQANSLRQFDAQQALCLAALDVDDDIPAERASTVQPVDLLVAAAQAFRRATSPRTRKQMRAMAAFSKAQHAPDDPV